MYVPGQLIDDDDLVVDIGTGYYVSMVGVCRFQLLCLNGG